MGRSRRARLWVVWALRDARRRWLQVLSIAFLLGLGVGFFAALGSMSAWRKDSAEKSYAALRMHDLRVALPEGATLPAGALRAAVAPLRARGTVVAAEERLVVPVQVDASTPGHTTIVPGRIVGAPVGATIDELDVRHGRALHPADAGRPVVVLEDGFARSHDLGSAGRLVLPGGQRVRYVGRAIAPEYFVVTAPGASFGGGESGFAVLFTSTATAQRLSGRTGRVNELVVRGPAGTSVPRLERAVSQALHARLHGTGFTLTRARAEDSRRLIEKDAEGDQKTMNVFAFLLLGAATFAAFNLVSRTIEAQRREIGIGMALGVEPRRLGRRAVLLGVQIAVLGVAIGLPVGAAANAMLASVMRDFFPLPVLETSIRAGVFAQGAALGVGLPLLATALPLRRALAMTPVEAIRVGARSASSSGLAWLLRGVRVPGGSLGELPVRNVLRTPRRTATTALGIAAVVSIIVALAGMIDSFDATVRDSRAEALGGTPGLMVVDLSTPVAPTATGVLHVEWASTVGASQTSLRLDGELLAGDRRVDASLQVVEPQGHLWTPTLREGELPAAAPGVVIAQRAAEDLGLGVGDRVRFRHPVPTGDGRYALATTTLPVTGISTSPFRFTAYANDAARGALHVGRAVNRIAVVPAPGRTPEDVKRALLGLPAVASVQGAAAMSDAAQERMSQFTDILVITVGVGMVMALLIAYNSMSINADERAREHATMFAYGVGPARVTGGTMVESALIGALGTLLGIAGGYGILLWVLGSILPSTIPDLSMSAVIAPGTFAAAVLAGTVIVTLAPLLGLHRLGRMDIPSTLRVVE